MPAVLQSPKKDRPLKDVAAAQPIESHSNSTASDLLFAVRAQPASFSGSDAVAASAAAGSTASSREVGPFAALAAPAGAAEVPKGLEGTGAAMVSNTRRALGGLVHDPMARACCNAMLAGYANATPAAGDRAAALLQILKEYAHPEARSCTCACVWMCLYA